MLVRPRRRRALALGLGLLVVGVLLILAATFVHLAHALPLQELPGDPRSLPGLACAAAGSALVLASRAARRRLRARAPLPRTGRRPTAPGGPLG